MNVKQHALMRILQRREKQQIINDKTFQTWKSLGDNNEKVKQAEEDLIRIVKESDYEFVAKLPPENKKTSYYVNYKEELISVVIGQDIITCYEIKYSDYYNSKTNLSIMKTLIKEYESNSKEIEKVELKIDSGKEKLELKVDSLNREIEVYENKIRSLKEKKSSLLATDNSNKLQLESLQKKKEVLLGKIVKPIIGF